MPRGPSLLIIDEDPGIRTLLRRGLTAAGYRVRAIQPGRGALQSIAGGEFDLALVDIDFAADESREAIRTLREFSAIPIVALSIRGDEDTTAGALDDGADDFVHKPFSLKELLARIKNALRRSAKENGRRAQVVTGDLEIDLVERRVRRSGREVRLAVKPYEVLRVLAERAGQVVSREEILSAVWGPRSTDRLEYLRGVMRTLRLKLEPDPDAPRYLVTERRVGYRLEIRTDPQNDRSA